MHHHWDDLVTCYSTARIDRVLFNNAGDRDAEEQCEDPVAETNSKEEIKMGFWEQRLAHLEIFNGRYAVLEKLC